MNEKVPRLLYSLEKLSEEAKEKKKQNEKIKNKT